MKARLAVVLCSLLVFGCARGLDTAERAGQACEADADCNPRQADADVSCGWLKLCVAGRCEVASDAGGSQLVVCRPE